MVTKCGVGLRSAFPASSGSLPPLSRLQYPAWTILYTPYNIHASRARLLGEGMARPKRTTQEIEQMRGRILDAALGLLHEQGPESLSVRAIAERVGISHMSLYSYFDNHADLLAAVRRQQRKGVLARRAEALGQATTGDVEAAVRGVLKRYISFARRNPSIYRFLSSHIGSERIPKHAKQGLREEMEHLAGLMRIGMDRGVFVPRDPFLAAMVTAGMVNGPLLMYRLPGFFEASLLLQLEEEVVDAAIHYLTCEAE
jgi:AcrR family transcriptional regulator